MTHKRSPRFLWLCVGIGLMAGLVSCQPGNAQMPTAVSSSQSTAQPGAPVQATDGLNLPDPLAGLSAVHSYHVTYANTEKGSQKGQEIASNLTIEGWANNTDASELVQQTSTGLQPVYLNMAVVNGSAYTQQQVGGICRTAPSVEALISGKTLKLPPVFGAKLVGRETLQDIPANHYQFDEKSVAWQAGQVGKAQGELWIAQQGGYVLKYALTIDLPSGDFIGTRSWTYALDKIGTGTPVALPQGCLPLIADIPMMDKAAEIVQRPNFQKYAVSATLDQVVKFYKGKLTADGWTLLPGIQAVGGKETLEFVKNPKDGGRFAVIQMSEANGQTVVIVQSAVTKTAIVMDATPAPGAIVPTKNAGETPEADDESETPAAQNLPGDLPLYPGASVLIKNDPMMLANTGDAPDKVIAFYKQSMQKAGYTLDNTMAANGMNTQIWKKDQLQVIVVIMQQGGKTQISVAAGGN
jgi:hypothetical protein